MQGWDFPVVSHMGLLDPLAAETSQETRVGKRGDSFPHIVPRLKSCLRPSGVRFAPEKVVGRDVYYLIPVPPPRSVMKKVWRQMAEGHWHHSKCDTES